MTVSAKVRSKLPPSRLGKPSDNGYPMPDKKHARVAKGLAAMHNDPDKAAIDRKADAILARRFGGQIPGAARKPSLAKLWRGGVI